jgi:hypothetical protein
MSGYSSIPQRFDAPEVPAARTASPAPASSTRTPPFKGSGMKLGSKKTRQAELLDALGSELVSEELSAPSTPPITEPSPAPTNTRSSLPSVTAESVHIVIKEQIDVSLTREGGVKSMEVKGDMNLQVSDPALAHIKLALPSPTTDFGSDLQFKQHPNVAKFAPGQNRIVALKDPSRAFPVGQALAVLKWRYSGRDESLVPLSINCWPSPSNDGTCEVNIEYELENENVTLYDVVISIPLPTGSYPSITTQCDYSINPATHSLDWSIPLVSTIERSGTLEFTVGGDDASVFFPVRVSFVGQGSIAGIGVDAVSRVDGGEDPVFSVDAVVTTGDYLVI